MPADAHQRAYAPNPTAADWQVNNPTSSYHGMTGSAAGDVAAVGAGAVILYDAYRVVRMLP